jgi:cell division protein FtsI (penicillin-binding protein 3)
MEKQKRLISRLSIVVIGLFLLGFVVAYKLVYLQLAEGETYKLLAEKTTIKNFEIQPIRGNIYAHDGSLLATSVPRYTIHFDAATVTTARFQKNVDALADSLASLLGNSSNSYRKLLIDAHKRQHRYKRIARDLSFGQLNRLRAFPLFRLGGVRGGLIVDRKTVRERPLGKIAERTIGYEQQQSDGSYLRVGLEGAFGDDLRGIPGLQLRQKIANGEWKPLSDSYLQEPQDGYDIRTTIDVNIQDVTHHALLGALENFEAEHGTAIVMETQTGAIRAVANLGRTEEGKYYEKLNYAIGESHEPGSTFKLMALVAALEDKVVDTTSVIDTKNGELTFYGKYVVRDSRRGGYGKITLSEVFERSSNTGMVQAIYNNYKSKPEQFVNRLMNMGLHEPLGLPVVGEGQPKIPHPDKPGWDGLDLPWMAYGYGVSLTPMQTLAFYNAIANDGVMLRPRFLERIESTRNNEQHQPQREVINPSICSKETIGKAKMMLKGVVEKPWGTAHNIYNSNFAISGKTGTSQVDYTTDQMQYVSSFVGYFPSDRPKYSCIVVIHRPNKEKGYFGNQVAAPVFQTIAHKLYSSIPRETIITQERFTELIALQKEVNLTAGKIEKSSEDKQNQS